MGIGDLGPYMLLAIASMAICMVIIPVMIRFAPAVGMIDAPDKRKVHIESVPRIGGIGIVLGIVVPLLFWQVSDKVLYSFISGCLVLLAFGAWDDAKELRPGIKFIGQFIAAGSVVYIGDLYVYQFPFLGTTAAPDYIGKPFTVIAIVGMINALNLSDGLDGLAGGEALVSLLAIAFFAYQYDGYMAMAMAIASIGGIFGFLRFNSHPARIFMGDAGSQTLGFIMGVMVVYLTQGVNSLVSPVVALLLLGLPVVDSLIVFFLRAKRGVSLVVAAKDHLHHRLLGLGLYHHESVIVIYTIQILLVLIAVFMPYETDVLLLGFYLGITFILYTSITILEKRNWKLHSGNMVSTGTISGWDSKSELLYRLSYQVLEAGLMVIIIAAGVTSTLVPMDIGASSLLLLIILMSVVVTKGLEGNIYRLIIFVAIGFSVYLLSSYPPPWMLEQINILYIFFGLVSLAAFIAARLTNTERFQVTPLDYLVVIFVMVVAVLPGFDLGSTSIQWMSIQMIVLFYACELLMQNMKKCMNRLTGVVALALALIALRAFI